MAKIPAPFLILQSAALPFRFAADSKLEVLLITSSTRNRWIVPKGHLEPFLTPQESAAVEAYEEGGIYGEIQIPPIGSWSYRKREVLYRVQVYPLVVERTVPRWPEMAERRRQWFTLEAAADAVEDAELKQLILALPEFLQYHRVEVAAVG